jgi:SAM-dependent methyltransferase
MKKCLRCESLFASESWTCPSCGSSPATADGVMLFAPELANGIAGYAPELFETHGGDQAEGSFWTPARAALIEWALQRFAPRGGRFLEVGCGAGGVLARLEAACPDLELSGAEALLAGLTAAGRRLTRTRLMQLDAAHLPFDGEFDAVGAFDVIEHIQDEGPVLTAMARALRPAGALLLTVPQHPFLYGPADVAARHVRRYTAAGLVAQVR